MEPEARETGKMIAAETGKNKGRLVVTRRNFPSKKNWRGTKKEEVRKKYGNEEQNNKIKGKKGVRCKSLSRLNFHKRTARQKLDIWEHATRKRTSSQEWEHSDAERRWHGKTML